MKIAVDISPLESEHSGRGIGQYTRLLREGLPVFDPANQYVFFAGMLKEQVDVVHFPYFDLFRRTLNVPGNAKTIVTVHDLIPLKFSGHFPIGLRGRVNWMFQKHSLRHADAIITDSHASAEDIRNIINISPDLIQVVYLALPEHGYGFGTMSRDRTVVAKYSLPENYALYVGDVNWNKNIPGLLNSFGLLKKNRRFSDLFLVLVGRAFQKDIPETAEIKSIIRSRGLQESVLTPGYIAEDELPVFYRNASVYIQPSYYEGFGLPVLEAMQAGIPVVAAKAGSLPEVAGEAALYFDPYNVAEMSEKLQELLTDTQKQKKLIEKGKEQSKQFSYGKFIKSTVGVYEKVFQSP